MAEAAKHDYKTRDVNGLAIVWSGAAVVITMDASALMVSTHG
jgi:hypothetical protein